ncbi:glycerophosphoryl diester phosphodiesterase membrane domain-containing protein [Lactobacillus colini]|uniref:glycerophosphoryl diester phosphodiesterase membrane domain-containing protein n=1 Tax=Lactobacillus colini TaxID=1819254 RepID=UPI001AE28B83
MKASFIDIRRYSIEFKRHLLQYLVLFLGLDVSNQLLIIPTFRYVTTLILQASAIPFISYQNILTIITTQPVAFILLILELVLLISIIYVEFSSLLLGIQGIKSDNFSLSWTYQQVINSLKLIRPSSLILLVGYFILIIPFVDSIYRTPLLAKVQVPQFIMDYMTRSAWLATGLIVFFAIAAILGLRWVMTLPLMSYQEMNTYSAMKKSWQLTAHKRWWQIVKALVLVGVLSVLALAISWWLIYCCQLVWDLLPKQAAFIGASINMLLIQLTSEVAAIWSTVVSILLITSLLKPEDIEIRRPKRRSKLLAGVAGILMLVFLADTAVNNNFYLKDNNSKAPLIISHRGVSDHNGVQNTISALKKTAKLKPDYVEIDIHETKDKQFVIMHDENLEKLAGLNKTPKDLTLKQLISLTVREDGHQAKIASLDQYLKAVKKLKQKLLIEIKTTPRDSKMMLENFNKKYGRLILNNHYQVQSLDYHVVSDLHKINPKLFVLYIQPYNFTYPHSVADGYAMEYSTLNNNFIWQAHLDHHPVYAWTVNTQEVMQHMMFIHVDGLITDNVELAKKTISSYSSKTSYASRLKNYILIFINVTSYNA